jgi:hypothetical protein
MRAGGGTTPAPGVAASRRAHSAVASTGRHAPWRILDVSTAGETMDTTRVFKWQNYELLCSAKPVDAGRFAPNLVISKQVWPTRPREIAVPRGAHLTEDTAIDAAYSSGVEWIRNYG